MPYKSVRKGKCFDVENLETGKVHAKCTTRAKAQKQMNLLRGVEHGWTPSKKKLLGPTPTQAGTGLGPGSEEASIARLRQRSNVVSTLPKRGRGVGETPFDRFISAAHPATHPKVAVLPLLDQS